MYCITSGYVLRADKNGFAFVAGTPYMSNSVSGRFDEDGTFCAIKEKDVWTMESPHSLVG